MASQLRFRAAPQQGEGLRQGLPFFLRRAAEQVDEPEKQSIALKLIREHLREGTGVVSTQVLQGYAVGALKKLGLPDALVLSRLDQYARFDVVIASVASLKAGLAMRALHQLSFRDALIVQAARDGGCAVLLS